MTSAKADEGVAVGATQHADLPVLVPPSPTENGYHDAVSTQQDPPTPSQLPPPPQQQQPPPEQPAGRRVVSETNRSNQKVRVDDKMFDGATKPPVGGAGAFRDPARMARSVSVPVRNRNSEAIPTANVDPVKQQRDELIMDTNKSSIVSKRSVEKLYYADQPEFFRYFVSKFKRRSPLINRGYWLRMKAIEHAVARFLSERTAKRKVVINLGCG